MRKSLPLNFNWLFLRSVQDEVSKNYHDIEGFEVVDLPHNATPIPYHNFPVSSIQGTFTYKKILFCEKKWEGNDLFLTFEGVAHIADVFINDDFVLTHRGGYTPFTVDITEYVQYGAENMITVIVDSHENVFVPPFGGAVDYLGYGGIYREVRLDILHKERITQYQITTPSPLTSNIVEIGLDLSTDYGMLEVGISSEESDLITTKVKIQSQKMTIKIDIGQKNLWDIQDPYLYQIDIKLLQNEVLIDRVSSRFGFREATFKADGFYLNGKGMKLIGLNRHQSYPYVGYAMPKSMQVEDVDILKYELGCNIVRTSHYPQSSHFLDRCDEVGLLVMEEIPGWQHIGSSEWQELVLRDVQDMILRDRNRPSIILWGVRINESSDHHDLYTKTNQLARSLDPTRPTGGVRNMPHSEFLEDVYTFNDFIHSGNNRPISKKSTITKTKYPYLITEFNGHMFPTKRIDDEVHQVEHALRYARILNAVMAPKNKVAGAIGWCMNDYNTHPDFGSGDLVCYHGVQDMWRIPKLAHAVYASQQDLKPVLVVSSKMNMGDCPSGRIGDIYCFTNVDYVKVIKNGETIGTHKPDKKAFQHLNHAPIIIRDLIGDSLIRHEKFSKKDSDRAKAVIKEVEVRGANLSLKSKLRVLHLLQKYHMTYDEGVKLIFKYMSGWGNAKNNYRFEGYIGDEKVATRIFEGTESTSLLLDVPRKTMEVKDTYDVMRIRVRKVNQHQENLVYCQDVIQVSVSKAATLIGPDKIALTQGEAAFYIRTNNTSGVAVIEVTDGEAKCVEMVVVKV